jgi:hypothetical protein
MSAETLLAGHAGKIRWSSAYEDHPVRSPGAKRRRSWAGDIKKCTCFFAVDLPTIAPPTLRPSKGHELGARNLQAHSVRLAFRRRNSDSSLSASLFDWDGSSGRHKHHSGPGTTFQEFQNNYTAGSRTVREGHPAPLQNMLPVAFRNFFEGEEPPENEFSIFCILHPNLSTLYVRHFGRTPQDLSSSGGILASDDSIAQFCRDWNDKEGGTSPVHYDTRDVHNIQGIQPKLSTPFVVGLKGCYRLRDDPSLCVRPVGQGIVLNNHEEDKRWEVYKAGAGIGTATGAATNVERNGITRNHKGAGPVEVQKLQCPGGDVVNEEHGVGDSGGESKVAEVSDGVIGKGGIAVVRRRVENCGINVVERRVRGREELVRRARRDGDIVRGELVVAPVSRRLGRPNEIGHSRVEI